MQPEKLTVSAYARIRGVSHTAVQVAIKSGRLKNAVTKDAKGRTRIDPVVANLEWQLNTDASMAHNVKNKPARPEPVQPYVKPMPGDEREPPPQPGAMAGPSLNQSRAVREAYLARTAKLDYEERTGKLVDAAGVKNEAFRLARAVRDAMLGIPDRVAAEFAGITHAHEIHARLSDEIRSALEALQA